MEFMLIYIKCNLIKKMNSVIILAAGQSARFGHKIPKQFSILHNKKSVLDFSVDIFINHCKVNEIIIVVPKLWKEKIQKKYPDCKVIYGGENRSESSYLGLRNCSKKCKFVLIHDAARPLISNQLIDKCLFALLDNDGVIPCLNINDALISIDKKEINYLDRKNIKLVQTPQAFRYDKILSAYNNQTNALDDFSVLINNKKKIKTLIINGCEKNFKITTENDMIIAKKIIDEL
ncbi:MAG: hypothetical protein CMG09_05130 [Candidatus Marinimicrobia bacterium]|nr:hypothetical protein [Candidatus Neomarinimicrobiota bacterium]|tara:strand:+ start:4814 stop:5512 length:699 start_codon:yes stop_codon:yes gene_type:complete